MTIARSQPYRLDFRSSGDLPEDERQLATVVESADTMFEILFRDLAGVEASIPAVVDTAVAASDTISPTEVAALIAAAVAALPRYSLLTNGYAPDPELVFANGDVIDVRVA